MQKSSKKRYANARSTSAGADDRLKRCARIAKQPRQRLNIGIKKGITMQYDSLSDIYDEFNDGADYDKYLQKVYSRFDIPRAGLALDCGCGTGALMEKLFEAGYDCTGVDCS